MFWDVKDNFVVQWAVTTSVDFSLAQLIQVIILLATGGNNGGGYLASKYIVIAFHGGILLLHAIINSLSITWLSFFGQVAAAWNFLGKHVLFLYEELSSGYLVLVWFSALTLWFSSGVFVLMIVIPVVATERASAKFVFTHFNTENDAGIHSKLYIFVLGLLMSQYTLTGYDASAHMVRYILDTFCCHIYSFVHFSNMVIWDKRCLNLIWWSGKRVSSATLVLQFMFCSLRQTNRTRETLGYFPSPHLCQ